MSEYNYSSAYTRFTVTDGRTQQWARSAASASQFSAPWTSSAGSDATARPHPYPAQFSVHGSYAGPSRYQPSNAGTRSQVTAPAPSVTPSQSISQVPSAPPSPPSHHAAPPHRNAHPPHRPHTKAPHQAHVSHQAHPTHHPQAHAPPHPHPHPHHHHHAHHPHHSHHRPPPSSPHSAHAHQSHGQHGLIIFPHRGHAPSIVYY
ncbi:hypothetical protein B0H15DRAFT_929766 [Mycena belliarum]|uniref:Uncharacterized protein n=1 Tax=Mycena belliarum TaxID=1033014 RepID=A0AAD6U857_9AGAR|nr:hypothetical protein B0H15DRAFT_929766 [Mycena belliae]